VFTFRSRIPLGVTAVELLPAHDVVDMLASVENPAFEGMRVVERDHQRFLLAPDGDAVTRVPDRLVFRLSAGNKEKLEGIDPFPIPTDLDFGKYIGALRFKVKIFRDLTVRVVQPSSVRMIGVPADIAFNERIFRVEFDVRGARSDDKLVFEVLGPDEMLLGRFHLELTPVVPLP